MCSSMFSLKVLEFVTETKSLGIIIDNQLSRLSHIELICINLYI